MSKELNPKVEINNKRLLDNLNADMEAILDKFYTQQVHGYMFVLSYNNGEEDRVHFGFDGDINMVSNAVLVGLSDIAKKLKIQTHQNNGTLQ